MTFNREQLPDAISYFESHGLKLDGRGKWRTTRCNFHGGSDSMRINTESGGWVCMACNAKGGDVLAYHMADNCLDFVAAAKELGAWVDDGKPDTHHRPKPLPASAALQVLAFESTLTAVAAGNISNGKQLTKTDLARLFVAAQRINAISEYFQ